MMNAWSTLTCKGKLLFIPLSLLILLFFYLYKNAYYPRPDSDEKGLSERIYLFQTAGESEGLWTGKTVEQMGFTTFPFVLSEKFRFLTYQLFHLEVGGTEGRTISAVFTILTVLLLSLLVARSSWPCVALCMLIIGSLGSVIHSARSYRLEQEIVLLGVLGMFLADVAMRGIRQSRWTPIVAAFGSGASVAWAGSVHPVGVIFFLTLMLFAVCCLFKGDLRFEKSPAGISVAFLTGCVCVGLIAVFPIVIAWDKFIQFVREMTSYYEAVAATRLAYTNGVSPWLIEILPRWLAHFISFLSSTATGRLSHSPITSLLSWSFWTAFGICCVGLIWVLFGKAKTRALTLLGCFFLATMVVCAFFPTSDNYYLYPAIATFSFSIGILVTALRRNDNRSLCAIAGILLAGQFVIAVLSLYTYLGRINEAERATSSSMSALFAGKRLMAAHIQGSATYCDEEGWPATRGPVKSLFYAMANPPGELPKDRAIVFTPEWIELVASLSSYSVKPIDRRGKTQSVHRLLEGRVLSAIFFDETSGPQPILLMFEEARSSENAAPPLIYAVKGSELKTYRATLISKWWDPGSSLHDDRILVIFEPQTKSPSEFEGNPYKDLKLRAYKPPSLFEFVPQCRLISLKDAQALQHLPVSPEARASITMYGCQLLSNPKENR